MKLGTALLDLFFPPKCPFCHKILEVSGDAVCPDCQKHLPWLTGDKGERKVEFADGCFSPIAYREEVRDGIHLFKFNRRQYYAKPFGMLMAQCAMDHMTQRADAVTWAPLSKKRLRQRGFDQAKLLAEEVGRQMALPVVSTLEKVRHTAPQSGLEGAAERRANARGAYQLRPEAEVKGKHFILVDDVVTTGATLSECAALLKQWGAEQVWCLTLAQAGPDPGKRQEKLKNK